MGIEEAKTINLETGPDARKVRTMRSRGQTYDQIVGRSPTVDPVAQSDAACGFAPLDVQVERACHQVTTTARPVTMVVSITRG